MLVACRLAGLSALEAYYGGGGARAQFRPGAPLSMELPRYDVRPHACASILHASLCLENV